MATKVKNKYTLGRDVNLARTVVKGKSGKRITNTRAEKLAQEAIKKIKSSKFLGDTESEILLAKLYLDSGLYSDASQLYDRLCK
jgi:hypothetical protein